MTDELDTLINDGEPEEAESESTPETETQETESEETIEAASEETTEEVKGEETEAEEAEETKEDDETPSSDEESWTKAMALDERRKRQALEEELNELRKQTESSQESKDSPDPYEDPEGYKEHLRNEIRAEYRKDMINKSRQKILSEKGDDYLAKEKVFMDMAKENPNLVNQMNESWDPAQFAYDAAVDRLQHEEIKQAGGLEKWREKERERIKKELEGSEKESKAQESEQVPSLATASSASGGFATPSDEDLSDIAMGDNA